MQWMQTVYSIYSDFSLIYTVLVCKLLTGTVGNIPSIRIKREGVDDVPRVAWEMCIDI